MHREPLKERALGRWLDILPAIGLPVKALRNKHGPCPMCGGKDRFRFDNKGGTGSFFCNNCGAGDGIEFVKRFKGVEFKEAARLIEQHIGAAPVRMHDRKQPVSDSEKREEMTALWTRAKPITPDDDAGRYLAKRVGLTEFPACLRFSPDERYADPGEKPSWHPVMVAKVEPSEEAKAQGHRCALHRTYLDKFGGKAEVPSPRKMMGTMPPGAAVRLMPHEEVLGIGEGIETCFAASKLFGVPVWSALTEGLLQDWRPPANVSTVFVFGDNDASFAGQAAAFTLARTLKAKGLTVIVELPPRMGEDWNDILKKRGTA